MRSLRNMALSVAMTVLVLATLFPSYVKADVSLTSEFVEPVENWSFEDRDMEIPGDGVYGCPPWETNNGGWRELRGDCVPEGGDGNVTIFDIRFVTKHFGNYDVRADLDGDGDVDIFDVRTAAKDYGKSANRVDGHYSWYTSGGGDYQMWQWLDSEAVQAIAGKTVMFSFYFYPESVVSDGSQNNARAEIYYEHSGGNDTVYGVWIAPTELKWWNAYVNVSPPSTITAVKVIIHGKPNFKAYIDFATLTIIDEVKETSSYGNVTLTVATHYWFKKSIQPDGEVWFVPALHAESASGYGIVGIKLKIELWEPQDGFLHIYYCHQGNEEGYEVDPAATEEMQLRLLVAGEWAISIGTAIAMGYGLGFLLGAESQYLGVFEAFAGTAVTSGIVYLLQMFASDPNVKDSQEAGTNYVLEYWGDPDYPTYSSEYHPTPFVDVADASANVQWLFNSGSADTFTIKITASVWWGEEKYYPGHYDGSHWELDPVGWTHAYTYMTINPQE